MKPDTGDTPVPPAKGPRPSALPVGYASGTREGVMKPITGDITVPPPAEGPRPLRQAQGRLSALPVSCMKTIL